MKNINERIINLNKKLRSIVIGDVPKDNQLDEIFGNLMLIEPYIETRVRKIRAGVIEIDKEFVLLYLKKLENITKNIEHKKFNSDKSLKRRYLISKKILKLMLALSDKNNAQ